MFSADILARIRELHYPVDELHLREPADHQIRSFCQYDGHTWPCREYSILNGVEESEPLVPG